MMCPRKNRKGKDGCGNLIEQVIKDPIFDESICLIKLIRSFSGALHEDREEIPKSMKSKQILNIFLEAVRDDHRMHPAHISLYVVLFSLWEQGQYKNPINMRREELMKRAKISGRSTYQRCLKELQESGYIIYEPNFNRFANANIRISSPKIL